jgi:ABC-type nitrate/sulfonate/bicarbonate transport system permease component
VVLLAIAWELLGRSGLALEFPPFSAVLGALWRLVASGRLWKEGAFTIQAFVYGYALSLVVGIGIGLLMGRFRTLDQVLSPYVDALMSAPLIAFVPLFIVWFGAQSIWSRIAVVFIFGVFVVIVNTAAGVRAADRRLVEMAHSFGASERQLLWKVILPAATPLIMAGVRLGTARAVKGMIMGEMLITVVGLGGLIMEYGASFKTDSLFAVILVVILLAVLVTEIVQIVERRLLRWRHDSAP